MSAIDLHPDRVGNIEMGYLFEHLGTRFNKQANEEAVDHFTPREVIRMMMPLVYPREEEVYTGGIYREICDPACGTGGIFKNREFGFLNVTVERPVRLNFEATYERIAWLRGRPRLPI